MKRRTTVMAWNSNRFTLIMTLVPLIFDHGKTLATSWFINVKQWKKKWEFINKIIYFLLSLPMRFLTSPTDKLSSLCNFKIRFVWISFWKNVFQSKALRISMNATTPIIYLLQKEQSEKSRFIWKARLIVRINNGHHE